MIIIKSDEEVDLMRDIGQGDWNHSRKSLETFIKPGISTADIDRFVEDHNTGSRNDTDLSKGTGGFPASACVSINEEVVHGIPVQRQNHSERAISSASM